MPPKEARSRRRFPGGFLFTLVLILGLGIGFALRQTAPRIPVHEGLTLHEWVDRYHRLHTRAATRDPADPELVETRAALDALADRAAPVLLDDLTAHPTPVVDAARNWLANHVRFGKYSPFSTVQVEYRWWRAVRSFQAFGPAAAPALPRLVAEATNRAPYSLQALVALGEPAREPVVHLLATAPDPIVEKLLQAMLSAPPHASPLTARNVEEALPVLATLVRTRPSSIPEHIFQLLLQLRPESAAFTPLFLEGLENPSTPVRRMAALGLARSPTAAASFEDLARLFEHPKPETRAAACLAMGWGPYPASNALPLLLLAAQDPQPGVRGSAFAGLASLRPAHPSALRTVGDGLSDPDATVRRAALAALGQFGTNAADYAGQLHALAQDRDHSDWAVATQAYRKVLNLPAGIPARRLVRPPFPAAPYDPRATNPVPR